MTQTMARQRNYGLRPEDEFLSRFYGLLAGWYMGCN